MNHNNKYRNFNERYSDLTAEELIEKYYQNVKDRMEKQGEVVDKHLIQARKYK